MIGLLLACADEVREELWPEAPKPAKQTVPPWKPQPPLPLDTSPAGDWQIVRGPELAEGIAALSASGSTLWAVGSQRGGLYRWDGARWTTETVQGYRLSDVSAVDGRVFAVGGSVLLTREPDGEWQTTKVRRTHLGISAWSADLAIAMARDHAAHWNGEAWTEQRIPTRNCSFRDIVMTGPDHALAVGETKVGRTWKMTGCAASWDGTRWSSEAVPLVQPLVAVAARGPDDAVAVGKDGGIFRWDGAWYVDELAQANLTDVAVIDHAYVVTADDGVLLRSPLWTVERDEDLLDHRAITPFDGSFAMVRDAKGKAHEVVLGPEEVLAGNSKRVDGKVSALWAASDDAVWAGGTFEGVLHWDGTEWTTQPGPRRQVLRMWGSAADDVWAAATDGAWHFDGTTWTRAHGPPIAGATSVHGLDRHRVWFTHNRAVYSYDGVRWTEHSVADKGILRAVWAAAPDDVWAGGTSGQLYRFDGTDWSRVPTQAPGPRKAEPIERIWGASANDVWIGGDMVLFRFDGTAVAPVHHEVLRPWHVRDIVGRGPNDLWIVTSSRNHPMHFDGTAFHEEKTNAFGWDALAIAPGGGVWMGSHQGLIARRD